MDAEQAEMARKLAKRATGVHPTGQKMIASISGPSDFREPGGVLFEIATGPARLHHRRAARRPRDGRMARPSSSVTPQRARGRCCRP